MTERTRLFWLFLAGGLIIGGIAVADPLGAVPHTFQAGTTISASQVNANFEAIQDYVDRLEVRLADAETALSEVFVGEALTGTVVAFAGPEAPPGWLICDGRALDRTDPTYASLFGVIGAVYGGDGAPTFHLPDLRGRVIGGAGSGPSLTPRNLGSIYGSESHSHAHGEGTYIANIGVGASNIGIRWRDGHTFPSEGRYEHSGGVSGSASYTGARVTGTSASTAVSALQPTTTLNYIIKL